jgi:hypothetical protein
MEWTRFTDGEFAKCKGFAACSNSWKKSRFGILCLTAENLDSSWMNFEAGAMAKSTGEKLLKGDRPREDSKRCY